MAAGAAEVKIQATLAVGGHPGFPFTNIPAAVGVAVGPVELAVVVEVHEHLGSCDVAIDQARPGVVGTALDREAHLAAAAVHAADLKGVDALFPLPQGLHRLEAVVEAVGVAAIAGELQLPEGPIDREHAGLESRFRLAIHIADAELAGAAQRGHTTYHLNGSVLHHLQIAGATDDGRVVHGVHLDGERVNQAAAAAVQDPQLEFAAAGGIGCWGEPQ